MQSLMPAGMLELTLIGRIVACEGMIICNAQ